MKTRISIFVLAAVLLAGCNSGDSSYYTEYSLNKKFEGHPINEFFHAYGFPSARFEKSDGQIMYRWASSQLDVYPAHAHPEAYYSDKGTYEVVDEPRGGTRRQYCELRIHTDRAETIHKIDITVDSMGKWSNSRCSEIF